MGHNNFIVIIIKQRQHFLTDCIHHYLFLCEMGSRRETAIMIGVDDDDVLKPLVDDENSTINAITTLGGVRGNYAGGTLSNIDISNSNNQMTLRIKSSYGDMEIEIPNGGCPKTTSVAKTKALVLQALARKEEGSDGFLDRHLRLICKGKLLSPDESFLSEFKVADSDVVHAVLGQKGSNAQQVQPPQSNRGQRQQQQHPVGTFQHLMLQRRRRQRANRGIGTIVGPGGRVTRAPRPTDESDNDDDDDEEAARDRRGFDRLRSMGLSRQEITAIRAYFNRHVDRYVQQLQNNNEESPPSALHLDEPDLSRRRLLVEEEWMATQGASSEFQLNLNQNTLMRYAALTADGVALRAGAVPTERTGGDRDFIWGFCLGFFVGILGLVWVWIPSISHKQKLGILTGICFQLIMDSGSKGFDDNGVFYEGE